MPASGKKRSCFVVMDLGWLAPDVAKVGTVPTAAMITWARSGARGGVLLVCAMEDV